MKSQLSANAIWGLVYIVVTSASAILSAIIVSWSDGIEQWGNWALASSIFAIGASIDFGMGRVLTKYVAEWRGIDDNKTNKIINAGFTITILLGILFVLVAILVKDYFLGPAASTKTGILFYIAAIAYYIKLLRTALQGIISGCMKINIVSRIQMLSQVSSLIGALLGSIISYSMIGYCCGLVLGLVIEILISRMVIRKELPSLILIAMPRLELRIFKDILKMGVLLQIGGTLNGSIDPLIKMLLSRWSGMESVGIFDIFWKVTSSIASAAGIAYQSFLPLSSMGLHRPHSTILKDIYTLASSAIGPPIFSGLTLLVAFSALYTQMFPLGMYTNDTRYSIFFIATAGLIICTTPVITALIGYGNIWILVVTSITQVILTASIGYGIHAIGIHGWPAITLFLGVLVNGLIVHYSARGIGLSVLTPAAKVPIWHWCIHIITLVASVTLMISNMFTLVNAILLILLATLETVISSSLTVLLGLKLLKCSTYSFRFQNPF